MIGNEGKGRLDRRAPAGVDAVGRGEGLQVVDDADAAIGQFVVRVTGFKLGRNLVLAVEGMVDVAHLVAQQVVLAIKRRVVRAIDLVDRECVEIGVEGLYVDGPVRGVRHPVHADQGATGVHRVGDLADRQDRPEDVRHMRDRHQTRTVGHERLQILDPGGVFSRAQGPGTDHDALFGQPEPGPDVRLVVEPGHDHLVAGHPVLDQPARQLVEQLGRGGAHDDFLGSRGVHQRRQRRPPGQHLAASLDRSGVTRAQLDVAAQQEGVDPVSHRPGNLTAARIIEEYLPQGQRGELRGHEVMPNLGQVSGSA